MRYIIQQSSEHPEYWVLTDTENGLVCRFRQNDFNATQQFTFLNDVRPDALEIAKIVREMGDWLVANHPEIAYEIPARIELGKIIKAKRVEMGLSIRQLATMCSMSKNNVDRIERGQYNYTIDNLNIIANALGLKLKLV